MSEDLLTVTMSNDYLMVDSIDINGSKEFVSSHKKNHFHIFFSLFTYFIYSISFSSSCSAIICCGCCCQSSNHNIQSSIEFHKKKSAREYNLRLCGKTHPSSFKYENIKKISFDFQYTSAHTFCCFFTIKIIEKEKKIIPLDYLWLTLCCH